MSSVNAGSSCLGCGRSVQGEKPTRRGWFPHEEEFLIQCLKELVATSWKADNGFKMGYQQRIEEMMKRQFPGTDIREKPHINSKLQIWKKHHQSLTSMLSRSGVGFNSNGKHMIECEDEQWEQIVKVDPGAKAMRYKPWPLYEQWCEIFGKDRATGAAAEDVEDAADDMNDNFGGDAADPSNPSNKGDAEENEGENSRADTSSKEPVDKPAGKGKKRKQDNISVVATVIGELGRSTSARLEEIAARIGYEFDIDKARMDAYGELGKIPNFSKEQKFEIAEIFVDHTVRLLLFKGLPPEDKAPYVHRMLQMRK